MDLKRLDRLNCLVPVSARHYVVFGDLLPDGNPVRAPQTEDRGYEVVSTGGE